LPGDSIGPYQIREKLGSGGMGEVFLCLDTRLQRMVALKCLTNRDAGDDDNNILREARAAARLTNPHIASVYDVLEYEGRAFIVMEYVEGESLRTRLLRSSLSPDLAIAIGLQLADALCAAHTQGVIHRDLKPSNIQLMQDGTVKVLDFGVAKVIPRVEGVTEAPTTRRTGAGGRSDSPGTPVYMSPEQLIGGRVDTRSDIYSLGVVLFEMVTGRRPYIETDAVALAVAMTTSRPPPPDAIDPRVPRRLSSVIVKALQHEPFNRYQSARELGDALQELIEPTTREVPPPFVENVSRRRFSRLALAAVVVAVAGALGWLIASSRARTPAPNAASSVLAILPVDNPTGDPHASYLGEAMASLVAANFRTIGSLNVVSRASTIEFARRRNDLQALKDQLGAAYVLDVTVKTARPSPELTARLRRPGDPEAGWQQTLSGDPVEIERALIEGVARTLSGWTRRRFTDAEWSRLRRLPTARGDAVAAYTEARALLEQTNVPASIERAIARLQDAINVDPSFAGGHAWLGAAILMRWERVRDAALIERATPAVTKALQLDPELSAAHYANGMLLNITGRRDAAVQSLRRAIELDPDSDDPHRLLGWRLLSAQGKTDEAVGELREAVRIRPDSFENYYRLGNVLYLAGRYREAVDAFRAATELQPRRADVFTNLGATYHMLGDVEQAIGNYQHAISLGAGDAQAYGNLAYFYFLAGRDKQALQTSLEAVKRDPTRASLQRDLGDYYSKLGRTREAHGAYQRAIELAQQSYAVNSRDAAAVMIMALSEAHIGDRVAAERHVAEALTLAPDDRDTQMRSAKVYIVLGNATAALEHLQVAIERGYSPQLARDDPELTALKSSPGFENAVTAGQRARARAGTSR
jgi:serine/threonine protein kinase/tetratricopeptide (TPR) repeat protein